MLEPITSFSLASHDGPYESWPLRTPLFNNGVATRTQIPGFVLDAQYRCADGFLLITSWDCPFEESYDFSLLGHDYALLARASLGVPYGTFLLHAHWPLDDQSLRLHFYTDLIYTLRISPPSGLFHRSPRLTLQRHHVTPSDPRTHDSIASLTADLHSIRDALSRDDDSRTHRKSRADTTGEPENAE
jgi:hypothetical protein